MLIERSSDSVKGFIEMSIAERILPRKKKIRYWDACRLRAVSCKEVPGFEFDMISL